MPQVSCCALPDGEKLRMGGVGGGGGGRRGKNDPAALGSRAPPRLPSPATEGGRVGRGGEERASSVVGRGLTAGEARDSHRAAVGGCAPAPRARAREATEQPPSGLRPAAVFICGGTYVATAHAWPDPNGVFTKSLIGTIHCELSLEVRATERCSLWRDLGAAASEVCTCTPHRHMVEPMGTAFGGIHVHVHERRVV